MKKILSTIFALLVLLNANAENGDWKEETSKEVQGAFPIKMQEQYENLGVPEICTLGIDVKLFH